ncbi:MAG TPA: hypothetical protein VFZ01_19995, partial [Geminicoccaceae bacterium]
MESWSRSLDLEGLADAHGTPIQVYEPAEIERRFRSYAAFTGAAARVVFPAKANPSLPILREICRLGGGVACASAQEFFLARLAGFEPERIQLNTPAPEMRRALSLLVEGGGFVVDSPEILDRLERELGGDGAHGPVYVRINSNLPLGAGAGEVELPGHRSDAIAKFGVPVDAVVPALARTALRITGLHFHAGPNIGSLDTFRAILRRLHALVDHIHAATGQRIAELNVGGGLAIPFVEGKAYPSVEELARALKAEARPDLTYLVEPGRSLVGPAAGILTRVLAVKEADGRRWAIADVGSRDIDRIAIGRAPHQIVRAGGVPLPLEGRDVLSGSLCFADDTLLPRTSLDGIATGDVLFIQHCGAYSYHLPRQFDGRPIQGAIKRTGGMDLVRCGQPEEEVLNPTYTTYLWEHDRDAWSTPRVLDAQMIDDLNSDYLQFLSMHDAYEIAETRQLSENHYVIDFDLRSDVDFVSVPFCLRLACDGAITVALHSLGVSRKSFPVWADRVYLDGSVNIEPNRI